MLIISLPLSSFSPSLCILLPKYKFQLAFCIILISEIYTDIHNYKYRNKFWVWRFKKEGNKEEKWPILGNQKPERTRRWMLLYRNVWDKQWEYGSGRNVNGSEITCKVERSLRLWCLIHETFANLKWRSHLFFATKQQPQKLKVLVIVCCTLQSSDSRSPLRTKTGVLSLYQCCFPHEVREDGTSRNVHNRPGKNYQ